MDIDLESREHVIEFVRLVLTAMEEKQPIMMDSSWTRRGTLWHCMTQSWFP